MSNWKEYKLGEHIEVINGYAFKSTNFSDSFQANSLPVIKIKNVANGDVHLNDCHFHLYDKSLEKFIVNKHDILIALTGNHPETMTQVVGETSRYKHNEKALLNQRVAKVIAKSSINADFLYYYLKEDSTHDYLASQSGGSANQANISKSDIENITIQLPPLPEQTAIAETLCSLDNKIDLLHRQNKTLEKLAETLFRQWFIEEAENTWKILRICDVAKINNKTISKNYTFSEIEYLDTGSITNGIISEFQTFKLNEAPSRAQRVVENNDIVYSLVRPIQRHYGLLSNVKPNTVVSTGFCVITCTEVSPHFIYLLLTKEENIDYFDVIADGSTSAYPSLKPSDIANFDFLMPPKEKLNKFSEIVSSSWQKIHSNQKQIQNLQKLRDTLLPKLMSGEVRVKM